LANQLFDNDFEHAFLDRLRQARSNIAEHCDGERIYKKFVKPSLIDWEKAVAHYAVSSIFQNYPEKSRVFVYRFDDEHRNRFEAGRLKLQVGQTRATFEITRESELMCYAVLYMGEHNLTGGVKRFDGAEAYEAMVRDLEEAFNRADFPELIRRIDRHFGGSNYSLKSLFKDQQRQILNEILTSTREDLESRFRLISQRYTPLMRFLNDLRAPFPSALQAAADFILHRDVRRQFEADQPPDPERLRSLLEEARVRSVEVLDADPLRHQEQVGIPHSSTGRAAQRSGDTPESGAGHGAGHAAAPRPEFVESPEYLLRNAPNGVPGISSPR
jgi:hypothetical protein